VKAIERHIAEIERCKKIFNSTNSVYMKNDYAKAIRRLTNELKEYCDLHGYDTRKILRRLR
jgi:hypothetical protein